jgi:two-component system, OmpR family, sensor histidine kinase MprB
MRSPIQQMSLRWKIAVAVGAMAALAAVTIGLLTYRAARDRMYAEIDVSLTEATSFAGGDDRVPDWEGRGPGPISYPGPDFYQAQVLGPDGSVQFATSQTWEPNAAAQSVVGRPRRTVVDTMTIGSTRYRVRTTGLANGAVQVARPLTEVDRVLHSFRTRIIVLVILVTAAATLLGSLIAARVTAALRRLTSTADTVRSTGRFDVNVPTEGNDEVSRLGSAFGSMLESLDRSRAEQQRLVQDAGHELRTPLTSLRTNLDVLRRHPGLPDSDRTQIVDDLHSEVEEMVELVDEIVTVAAGVATDEVPTEFSLGDAARRMVERFARRTGRHFEVTTDESPVRAQETAVERAISNLLDNAAKFDPSGSAIEVRVADGDLAVMDRGSGIPPDELALVFERFHRATTAQSMPGSGLGLSIVRDVVTRNGGSVHAANREGGGAVIGFRLPRSPS